jgi:hypothetical protein
MRAAATIEQAIAALAEVDGTRPDEIVIGSFLVDTSYGNQVEIPRVVTYENSPQVRDEAARLLRIHQALEAMYAKIKEDPCTAEASLQA